MLAILTREFLRIFSYNLEVPAGAYRDKAIRDGMPEARPILTGPIMAAYFGWLLENGELAQLRFVSPDRRMRQLAAAYAEGCSKWDFPFEDLEELHQFGIHTRELSDTLHGLTSMPGTKILAALLTPLVARRALELEPEIGELLKRRLQLCIEVEDAAAEAAEAARTASTHEPIRAATDSDVVE